MSTTPPTRTLLDDFLLTIVLPVCAAIVILIPIGVAIDWHNEHVACLRLHEQTNYDTHMAGTALGGECYIQIDNRWIPANQYRMNEWTTPQVNNRE